jgi:hypothetical protein
MSILSDRQKAWWADFFGEIPGEVKENTIELGDTLGQTIGGVIAPTAGAVSKPIFATAALVAGVAVTAYLFKDQIRAAIKWIRNNS